MDKIKFVALGGLDESGRDCYVIEINDDIFVIEAGYSVPDKNIPGVDFLLPNFDYLIQNKDRIKGYFLTHGHDENMGCLQFAYDYAPAPIYCTLTTKTIIEAEAKRFALKPKFQFCLIDIDKPFYVANRRFIPFQTMHNAAFSHGLAISTDRGNIVYTGDYIVDFNNDNEAYHFALDVVGDLADEKTFILLAESKNANKPGYCAPKHKTIPLIEKYFKNGHKRIFISCFWQNFYRINEICDLVKKYHKKIYFYNDYTSDVMSSLMSVPHALNIANSDIIPDSELLRVRQEDVVILLLGRGDALYREFQKLALCENDDKRIILSKDDIFINVAIPSPVQETLATKSMDTLYRNECQVVWVKSKMVSSMHACQDDLKFFLSVLKPQYYLPVRGRYVNMIANAKLALMSNLHFNHNNIFLLDNGNQLIFDDRPRPTILSTEDSQIKVSPVLVHGRGISKMSDGVINDRLKLGVDGVIVVACGVSRNRRMIVSGPDCQMRGFVFAKEAEPILKTITQIFVEEVKMALLADATNYEKAISNTKERCRRFIRRENGREPLIIPLIIPIND